MYFILAPTIKIVLSYVYACANTYLLYLCSQFMDDNEDGESQKFLANGLMKKKKYEEYHEEYVSISLPSFQKY